MSEEKTHYRSVFDSPYLSSADIVEPTVLTISKVIKEIDKTKKTKSYFNTAYFSDKELRPGELLKPMILNATNSRTMSIHCNSKFIEDWRNITVTIYIDNNVRFGRDTVEGLRISSELPPQHKPDYISEDQAIEVEDLIKEKGVDLNKFLAYAKAKDIKHITVAQYPSLLMSLKSK